MIVKKVLINKAHYPVNVLGYGKRAGIWFQGCDIGCPGCISQDTWTDDPDKTMSTVDLVSWVMNVSSGFLDGITITGGEPFRQPEALLHILELLHNWRSECEQPFDILCYSGYKYYKIEKDFKYILDLLDAIVPEPFIEELMPGGALCGSSNQRVIPLSQLGAARYKMHETIQINKRMQVMAHDGRLWFIGIPEQNDMSRMERLCIDKGLTMTGVSWRA